MHYKNITRHSLLIAALFFGSTVIAQTPVAHTIKQGETLSAIAKQYNTTVGDIMRLNGMNSTSKLQIGAAIKIPAKGSVVVKPEVPVSVPVKEVAKPKPVVPKEETVTTLTDVTYNVAKGESLYSIAKKNHTTEAQLKTWNGFKDDKIKIGQTIIVGKEPITKSTIPVTEKPQVSAGVIDQPAVTKTAKTAASASDELPTLSAPSAKVTKKPEPAKNKPVAEVKDEPAVIPSAAKYADTEGYFANFFNRKENKSTNPTSGDAAVFKTTSGWSDKKYYVLINDIAQGTIVRVTANNKSICAKVLGPLPDIKEDNGLLLRLSNAAAATLGIDDVKFMVTVNY